eukprot:TRINITY_DN62914_c0_g1_i1.p1 TRINITY_DN62914_c0_g1~~TRINITY_DN62914_c0_g1_i1.p1  ORF type:complete len:576 (+),score=130.13 TRINITY_DN62914_c0_g1_i1:119-1846(+)
MSGKLVGIVVFIFHALHAPSPADAALQVARQQQQQKQLMSILHTGQPSSTERLRFLLSTVNRFRSQSLGSRSDIEARHAAEDERLEKALERTKDAKVRQALAQSLASHRQSLAETRRTYDNMVHFSDSMVAILNATGKRGSACEVHTCGEHASCTDTTDGAQCVCNEGYVGSGFDCRPPPEFAPHRLLFEGAAGVATQATDMSICVFELNKIAVVFTDLSKGRIGRIIVGSVREAGMADLAPPEQFTLPHAKAWNPVVQGSSDRRLLIAWRDEDRGGTGWVRGVTVGTTGVRGADLALTWGAPLSFASNQAHRMALVPLPGNRFGLMYGDRTLATEGAPAQSYGAALFIQVDGAGGAASVGTFRFSDFAVTRLDVTKVGESSFIVAARGAKAVDDMDPNITTHQEAIAIFGEAMQDDLVFDPTPVNFEPATEGVWARGVSLIAPNTFAYAYQSGVGQHIKLAVARIDPSTKRMQVVQQPLIVRNGFSRYVSMLNVPYTTSDPHTLTYYETDTGSMVNICSWRTELKSAGRCEEFQWFREKLDSVSGVHLGGGKAFMVFSTRDGTPYYSVFGLSKK